MGNDKYGAYVALTDVKFGEAFQKLQGRGLTAESAIAEHIQMMEAERRSRIMRVKLDEGAFLPTRAHEADGGYDLYSPVDATVYDLKGTVIDTGVHVQIPRGCVGFIKSRSGMNIKKNVVCEGVIDSGYTGSITVKLRLQASNVYDRVVINRGDRIAQLVLLPVFTPDLEEVDELEETERGDNGFGSSGR